MAAVSQSYRLLYRLDGEDRYLIWQTNDADGVAVDELGRLATFSQMRDLENYAIGRRIDLTPGSLVLHNLDEIAKWARRPSPETIDYANTLAAWNLFTDVWNSTPSGGENLWENCPKADRLYDKLFRASNLPAVSTRGEVFTPEWSAEEVEALAKLLGSGLEMFRSRLGKEGSD